MRNSPNYHVVALMGTLSLACLVVALILLNSISGGRGSYVSIRGLGTIVYGFAAVSFLSIGILNEFVERPKEVEVGEEIRLSWRFKGPQSRSYSAVADLFIELEAQRLSGKHGRRASIGFKDEKERYALSYEIAKAIEQQYVERIGHNPPLPEWAKNEKK